MSDRSRSQFKAFTAKWSDLYRDTEPGVPRRQDSGMSDTKPCPFCGSKKIAFSISMSQGFLACEECGANGPGGDCDPDITYDAALRVWNSRDHIDALAGVESPETEILALKTRVKELEAELAHTIMDPLAALINGKAKAEAQRDGLLAAAKAAEKYMTDIYNWSMENGAWPAIDGPRPFAFPQLSNLREAIAKVEVFGATEGRSSRDAEMFYRAGETVRPDSWDENRWNECSHGIHFFITRAEAEAYDL